MWGCMVLLEYQLCGFGADDRVHRKVKFPTVMKQPPITLKPANLVVAPCVRCNDTKVISLNPGRDDGTESPCPECSPR